MAGRHSGLAYVPFKGETPHRNVGLCWRKTTTRAELLTKLAATISQLKLC